MPKPKTYVYTVSGLGRFPIDMLRYDQATPATEIDSGRIAKTFDRHPQEVSIAVAGKREPTHGRWTSFGWSVTKVEGRS